MNTDKHGLAREALRAKGQFWTPPWLARAMAAWAVAERPGVLFDPAVGPGAFFAAARSLGFEGRFEGFELDAAALAQGAELGLSPAALEGVIIGDFLERPCRQTYPAIISNPPYIRHHRLSRERKRELQARAGQWLGVELDGRMGLHVYFFLKCLEWLAPGGRLAFLLPADICEGVSSAPLWRRLSERFRLEAVITFSEEAAPFRGVDTNALVIFLSNRRPRRRVPWLRLGSKQEIRNPKSEIRNKPQIQSSSLQNLFGVRVSGIRISDLDSVATCEQPGPFSTLACERDLEELLATGLSRPPRAGGGAAVPLSAFARVVRGIATGANGFFFLAARQIHQHGLDKRFFRRAIGRTRDCPGAVLRAEDLAALDAGGRPTWLLSLAQAHGADLPAALRAYLKAGEREGLPRRPLISTRKPWHKMEQRAVPALLFAYLGRRDCRFILNQAGAVPLTGFLCVYPKDQREEQVRRLWRALNHPSTRANLLYVGKSYGDGAIKVEPRQLEALEVPLAVLQECGLEVHSSGCILARHECAAPDRRAGH